MSATPVPRQPVPLWWTSIMVVSAGSTLGCCLWALWADVTAFDDVETTFWAGIAAALPVAVWTVAALVGLVRYTRWWRLGLLVPVFVSSTLALTWSDVPGRIGWLISRDAMDRAAAVCDSVEPTSSGTSYAGKRIGVYDFHSISRLSQGGCHFRLRRNYPVVRTGFDYLPAGERRNGIDGHTYYVHLGGSWHFYQWSE
ncbi:hypothetical protein [Nocardia sp. NPDC058497]|uniref:hypothetical protein n=1 Tax=Nocardia sp. NPDC058497 TaxID=3346529 RepID=UPI00365B373F